MLGHSEGGTMTVAPKFGCEGCVGVRACGVIGAPQSWQKAFWSATVAPHFVHVAIDKNSPRGARPALARPAGDDRLNAA
jgi:hypothetical protein